MTNHADPDQLASSEANWSGSIVFAKAGFSSTRVNTDGLFTVADLNVLLSPLEVLLIAEEKYLGIL